MAQGGRGERAFPVVVPSSAACVVVHQRGSSGCEQIPLLAKALGYPFPGCPSRQPRMHWSLRFAGDGWGSCWPVSRMAASSRCRSRRVEIRIALLAWPPCHDKFSPAAGSRKLSAALWAEGQMIGRCALN
eukprot:1252369-Pyramimonas_sp.AAC.1